MRSGVFGVERDGFVGFVFSLFGQGGSCGPRVGGRSGLSDKLGANNEVAFGLEIGAVTVTEFGEEFLRDVVHS